MVFSPMQLADIALLLAGFVLLLLGFTSDRQGLLKVALGALCVTLAASYWDWRDYEANLHPQIRVIEGPVSMVQLQRQKKSGSGFTDDVQLRLANGSLSPLFSTQTLGDYWKMDQPIHMGDVLRVAYRMGDAEALRIDEVSGQNPGWSYLRRQQGWFLTWLVGCFMGAAVIFKGLVSWYERRWAERRDGKYAR